MATYAAEEYRLRDIVAIFVRWRKLAVIAFLAVLVPGVLVTLLMPPLYEASASLLVSRPTIAPPYSVRTGQGMDAGTVLRSVNRDEEVKTFAETVRTRKLIESTIAELDITNQSLNRIRDFRRHVQAAIDWALDTAKELASEAKYALGLGTRPSPEEKALYEKEVLLDKVDGRLRVVAIPDTNILRVSFRSSDPALAQAAVNKIVTGFVEANQHSDEKSVEHFAEDLRQFREELLVSEKALADFRAQSANYSTATQRDLLLQSVERLRGDLAELEARAAQKRAAVGALRERLWSDPRLQRDINKGLIDAEVELAEATAQVGVLRKTIAERREELAANNASSVRLKELERNVAKAEDAFALRQRNYEQARMTESLAAAKLRDIRIVDLASYPISPVRPRTLLYLGVAFGAALLAAFALPFVAHLNDTTLGSEQAVARLLDLPLVVSVARQHRLRGGGRALIAPPSERAGHAD